MGMDVEVTKDKMSLIRGQIEARQGISYDILSRIYDDIFTVEKLRTGLPFPARYEQGKSWSDLNKHELDLRVEVRKEMKEVLKDNSFSTKDLRDSILEYKVQSMESKLMSGGLEDTIEPDGSYQQQGDTHPP